MQEPEVAAGDAGDCGDGLAVGEAGAVPGEAELAVKPGQPATAARALAAQGRPPPGGEERGSAVTRNLPRLRDIRFRAEHLDSELMGC